MLTASPGSVPGCAVPKLALSCNFPDQAMTFMRLRIKVISGEGTMSPKAGIPARHRSGASRILCGTIRGYWLTDSETEKVIV